MKPQLNSKQTLGPALPLCLSASLCDLWAAEVNGSHVLIVLWSRHGALAPRRVRLTKVKSAGSIKAHLRVAEPPPHPHPTAWLQGCGRASSTLDFSQPKIIIKWQIIWLKNKSSNDDDLTQRVKLTWTYAGLLRINRGWCEQSRYWF